MIMKRVLILITILVFAFSCRDESLTPVLTIDKAEFGAYPKLSQLIANEFDLNDIPNSQYQYDVEFVSSMRGQDVAEYNIYVSLTSPNAGNKERVLFLSVDKASFTNFASGNKGYEVRIGLTDLTTFFEVDPLDLEAGDAFGFFTELVLDDDRTFDALNSSATVRGANFGGFFTNSVKATCPLPDNLFVGEYAMTVIQQEGGLLVWGLASFGAQDVTISLVPGSTTLRSIPLISYPGSFDIATTMVIEFVCEVVSNRQFFPGGLSCGSPGISFDPGTMAADIFDDSVFDVTLYENAGACGQGSNIRILRFTKK